MNIYSIAIPFLAPTCFYILIQSTQVPYKFRSRSLVQSSPNTSKVVVFALIIMHLSKVIALAMATVATATPTAMAPETPVLHERVSKSGNS